MFSLYLLRVLQPLKNAVFELFEGILKSTLERKRSEFCDVEKNLTSEPRINQITWILGNGTHRLLFYLK